MVVETQVIPNVHRLKCHPIHFGQLWNRDKWFELRRDDRGYRVGDLLMLCEWDRGGYSGAWVLVRVTSLVEGDDPGCGVLSGDGPGDAHVVMGIVEITRDDRGVA